MQDFLASGMMSDLLLEHVPAAVALFDTRMRYLACSRRWLIDYGIQGQDVIGKSHYEVFPEIDERWRAIHRRALSGATITSDAEPFLRANGSVDWVEWKIVPWRTSGGEIGGVALFTQVLTEVVESKRQARSLSSELDLLVDSARHHAICMLDAVGNFRIWNTGAERLYGWRDEEVLGRHYEMMFEAQDREAGLPVHQIAQATDKGVFHGRSWRVRKDGTRFLADVTLSRIVDEHGVVVGFGQVVRDITDENDQARALAASAAQMRSIMDTVPDAMITIDQRGIILSFSVTAEQLFGYSAGEVIGQNVSMLMVEADARRHDDYLARYRSTGERRIICNMRRVLGRRKDGSIFPHELYVGEAEGGDQRIFTGFLRDLTGREEAEAKLRELQAELVHISRVSAVGTMATALAHELNQPLTAIANYVQTSAALLSGQQERALDLVRQGLEEAGQEALRAGAIVQRLREFVARGDLDRAIVAPIDLATQARDLGYVGGRVRGIACEISVPQTLPPVLVDRVQVQQVLLNLIRNAFEALGDRGEVTIGARPDTGMIRFSVVDNGPGILPGTEDQVFEPFISSKATGMGIGLAICRTIIEAHGGQLWFETPAQGGAAFYFTVPLAEVDDD